MAVLTLFGKLRVPDTTGDMPGRNMFSGRITMDMLVVKKDIRAESRQERTFRFTTEKQGLINTYPPFPQRQDDPFVGRC